MLTAQVVNAIRGVFKNGYFSNIYTLENVSSLSIIMFGTSDLMVWMNYWHLLLWYELNGFLVTMTTVTMATIKISNFLPQNHIFGPGAIASKGLHGIFSLIYVHISVTNQAVLGHYSFMVLHRRYWSLKLIFFVKMHKIEQINLNIFIIFINDRMLDILLDW